MKNRYKIYKFQNGFGETWYQIKEKFWFFYEWHRKHYLGRSQGIERFDSIESAKEKIKVLEKSKSIKLLEVTNYEI